MINDQLEEGACMLFQIGIAYLMKIFNSVTNPDGSILNTVGKNSTSTDSDARIDKIAPPAPEFE